jgi:hypothetical protein
MSPVSVDGSACVAALSAPTATTLRLSPRGLSVLASLTHPWAMDTRGRRLRPAGRRRTTASVVALVVAGVGCAAVYASPDRVHLTPSTDSMKLAAISAHQPDAQGLTDADRIAYQRAHPTPYQVGLNKWFASDFVRSLDLHSLPQSPSGADPARGYASLQESIDHADLIVLGQVESVRPTGLLRTTFRVDRAVKGDPGRALTFDQVARLDPFPDWGHPQLVYSVDAPLLLPGDRALLMLEINPNVGPLIINFSGEYRSTAGRISTVKDNLFHDVDGLTENELLGRIYRYMDPARSGLA